jgi:hypothetical protein
MMARRRRGKDSTERSTSYLMRSTCVLFRQTQQRSSCRSPLLITRAYAQETAQQQIKYSTTVPRTKLRLQMGCAEKQELVTFFPMPCCMMASLERSDGRTRVPGRFDFDRVLSSNVRLERYVRFLAVGIQVHHRTHKSVVGA